MAAPWHPWQTLSHARKVRALYKAAVRNIESMWAFDRLNARYDSVLMRKRFDDNKNITDPRIAKKLLLDGEKEYKEKYYPAPLKWATAPGGCAHLRYEETNDMLLDHWHPLEKAQYPEYFAIRDIRKREAMERWEKKYGKPEDPKLLRGSADWPSMP